MAVKVTAPRVAAAIGASLGEGPVWDAARECLWFVDIKKPALYRYWPESGDLNEWAAPGEMGWVTPTVAGDLLCGVQDGLYRFDPDSGAFTFWRSVEPDVPTNRLNDAAVDAAGRVYFGSMDNGESAKVGRFYRLADGDVEAAGPDGIAITNGPALSPDGRTIYYTDTLARIIYSAPVGDDGSVGDAKPFIVLGDDTPGYPDGPVVDSEGTIWCSMYAGWGIRLFNASGEATGFVEMPVANITKVAFGGVDGKSLFVTTAAQKMSADERAAQPMAGHLFRFECDVAGQTAYPAKA